MIGLVFAPAGVNTQEKEKIKIAGSGGMIPLVTQLAGAFMKEHPAVMVQVNQASIQSSGGIKGTADGLLQIGMANRELKDDEKDLGLTAIEIARVGVAFAVNKNLSVRALSSSDICGIYSGAVVNWKDLGLQDEKITALTKPDTDATKELVRKSLPCFASLKEPASVSSIPTSPAMAEILSGTRSIGITDMVDINASQGRIVGLTVDGTAPTLDTIKSGQYKLVQSYRLVVKGSPTGTTKAFIDFVRSQSGAKIIEARNAVPVK